MAFHEVRFPVKISFGSSGGPMRKTDIVELASGDEERNSPWLNSKHKFNAAYGIRSMNQVYQLKEFFEARHGKLNGFRYKDWSDYKSCAPDDTATALDQIIGTGDNSETDFQLVKAYTSGSQTYTRTIIKPVSGTVLISVNNTPMLSGWTVSTTTGIVTFDTAPAGSATIRAGFEFDVPVRFDTDELIINLAEWRSGQIPDIPIVEVRR